MVPKVRNVGYVPFFVTERKRSEAELVQVVQEAFIQGVTTRKMEKLAKCLGIEGISRNQVSEMTKGLNEQAEEFRNRPLTSKSYPVLWVNALYEKVRYSGCVVSMAILLVCGVNEEGRREVLEIEPMLEESKESYKQLFGFADLLKGIWLTSDLVKAKQRAQELADQYRAKCSKAIETLEDGLEDAPAFLAFPKLDSRKVSSNSMLERLNKEIRRRTRVAGIFPNPEFYLRLVTVYLMEYSEDWSVTRSYLSEESLQSLDNQAA